MRSLLPTRLLSLFLLPFLLLTAETGTGGWFCATGKQCEAAPAATCCCGPDEQAAPAAASPRPDRPVVVAFTDDCGCYFEAVYLVATEAQGLFQLAAPAALPSPQVEPVIPSDGVALARVPCVPGGPPGQPRSPWTPRGPPAA